MGKGQAPPEHATLERKGMLNGLPVGYSEERSTNKRPQVWFNEEAPIKRGGDQKYVVSLDVKGQDHEFRNWLGQPSMKDVEAAKKVERKEQAVKQANWLDF